VATRSASRAASRCSAAALPRSSSGARTCLESCRRTQRTCRCAAQDGLDRRVLAAECLALRKVPAHGTELSRGGHVRQELGDTFGVGRHSRRTIRRHPGLAKSTLGSYGHLIQVAPCNAFTRMQNIRGRGSRSRSPTIRAIIGANPCFRGWRTLTARRRNREHWRAVRLRQAHTGNFDEKGSHRSP
jgi:hypothetical protein